jgi:phage shock protein PspC (stress-responsive transcriptional regulator)
VARDDVITSGDVKAIRKQLGEPRDFGDDEDSPELEDEPRSERKYYRDTDNAVLGGVMAGLAAYMGWDVTLLRVLAVVLAIVPSWGTLVIVYIVVWICAPAARTVSEKMTMRGEAINLDSIKQSAKKFGEKAEAAGREMTERAEQIGQQFESRAPQIGAKVGRVARVILGVIGILVSTVILCGLIVSCVWMIPMLVSIGQYGIGYAPLLVAAVGLVFSGVLALVIFGMICSSMLIGGRSRGGKGGLLATLIIAMALLVGAAAASVGWLSLSTPDDRQYIKDAIGQKIDIQISDDEHQRVKVEVEPFKINIEAR